MTIKISNIKIAAVVVVVLCQLAMILACPSKPHRPDPTTPPPTARPTTMPPPATANIFFVAVSTDDPAGTNWFKATEECASIGLSLPTSISGIRMQRIEEFFLGVPATYPDVIELWRGPDKEDNQDTCRSVLRTRIRNEASYNEQQDCSSSLQGFLCEGSVLLSDAPDLGLIRCTGACALFFE